MYQAGVKDILLIENKNITFRHFDPADFNNITDLNSEGKQISIENMLRPEYEAQFGLSNSGDFTQTLKTKFFLLGQTFENLELINDLSSTIYGWCLLVTFYDGTSLFYKVPMFIKSSEIKPHSEKSFSVELGNNIPSIGKHYSFVGNISSSDKYRFDTTILTWDNSIYTFDYEL